MKYTIEEKEEKQDNNPYHVYDNAFLSACFWDKRLLIPLVNEIFQKHLSENAVIEHSSNESFTHQKDNSEQERLVKRITDALVRADGGKYHFECESKNDGEILIRIAEYDMQIALNDAIYNNHCVTMELPDTAVIFLRNHHSLPTYGNITYVKGADTLSHNIPYFEVGKYDLDDLAAKHLYILFPFYLMRYEHAIRNNTESKFAQVENEAYRVYDELTKAYNSRVLSQKEYEDIITLCNDVVKEISKDSQLKERLVEIMGNEIFKTAEERGEEKGILKATLDNIKNAMVNGNMTFDQVCNLLGINDKEKYRSQI